MDDVSRKALYDQQTSKVFVDVARVAWDGGGELRLVNDMTDLTVDGQVYSACGMSASESGADGDRTATLAFAGVTGAYAALMRTARNITVTLSTVRRDAPGVCVAGPNEYSVRTASIDSAQGVMRLDLDMVGGADFYASRLKYTNRLFPCLEG